MSTYLHRNEARYRQFTTSGCSRSFGLVHYCANVPDADQKRTLLHILDLVRSGKAVTRPDIARSTQLGRAVVTQRLDQLIDLGLIIEGDVLAVPHGRSPRGLRFNKGLAHVLCADIGASGMFIGLANLAGEMLERVYVRNDIANGPEVTLSLVEEEFDKIVGQRGDFDINVWGIGLGIPGPVEFSTGRAVAPPIMPGWNEYDIRKRLQDRYNVPVWVDNDVNVMALGEVRCGAAVGYCDVVVIKISTGIGAGLVSNGVLHRGAQGAAGDIGHIAVVDDSSIICRCGNIGCLETLASGSALAARASEIAESGASPFLATRLASHPITVSDVVSGAASGDHSCLTLMTDSARLVGDTVARIVNFYNPSLILLGGRLMIAGDAYLAAVRNIVYSRSLPLATRELVIAKVGLGERAALHGAASLALDSIFAPEHFATRAAGPAPALLPTAS